MMVLLTRALINVTRLLLRLTKVYHVTKAKRNSIQANGVTEHFKWQELARIS